ncbi:hypothetical protein MBM_04206 [Drepanopeziza brunnea f. sp. 'multigermtubi' MB_m1]|uniref:Uncharacterized protein n=1 Tax=Marssonina brunnea f. sp. multigermtubi (strain MB_m1) TaxID=1072389 RepID=K1WI92_MARBU|nr:uncharacterized protein MBM_04206 [Drepanopeziza brunnea f. sp. 'multigermtubi' MB_m1]EKD17345.1 hypothetical protein MBM_04206 [Drepanopeziza brunnea f. sp. 'multigermtubi' MB_m1]
MLFKQITQFNRIVKRGRSRLKNLLFALTIAATATAAAAAAILRTLTFEPSLFPLNLFIKRLLMLTTVKALKCIKCINNKITSKSNKDYYNCDTSVIRCLRYAKNIAFLRSVINSPSGLANKSKSFKSNPGSFTSFAFAFKTFNLNVAFIRLNSFIAANRSSIIRSASSISSFPLALALAAFIALVAFAALVAFVALIIVALFALVIALTVSAAAPAVAMTLAER